MTSSSRFTGREYGAHPGNNISTIGFVATLLVLFLAGARGADTDTRLPNVVIFIMDDVGMGDIGCFGNDTIKTPNIA